MHALDLLLALLVAVPAFATPLSSGVAVSGGLVRRADAQEGYRERLKRQSAADNAKYPKTRKQWWNRKYQQSQEAAQQCFELNMLRHEYYLFQPSFDEVLDDCQKRHGFRPNPKPNNPEWQRRMQAIANKEGKSAGIDPDFDYNTLSDEERALLDEEIREEDDQIERRLGFRPQRGPNRQVIDDPRNSNQLSSLDLAKEFGAAGRRIFFGGDARKSTPPVPGAPYVPQVRRLKPFR